MRKPPRVRFSWTSAASRQRALRMETKSSAARRGAMSLPRNPPVVRTKILNLRTAAPAARSARPRFATNYDRDVEIKLALAVRLKNRRAPAGRGRRMVDLIVQSGAVLQVDSNFKVAPKYGLFRMEANATILSDADLVLHA